MFFRKYLNMSVKSFLSFVLVFGFSMQLMSQSTEIVYLSGRDAASPVKWEFKVDKGRNAGVWSEIPVPSNWELHGFGEYDYGHVKKKSDETGFYKQKFNVAKETEGKKIFIVFEGSMTDTEVKINGELAGDIHQGGFYRFQYDITNLVNYGEDNLLEVKVNKVSANKSIEIAERKSDYWVFGGIFRPVYLKIVPKQFIQRTAINARADGSFSVDVFCDGVDDADRVEAQIVGLNGKALGSKITGKVSKGSSNIRLETTVKDQRNWTAESPSLYYVNVSLKNRKGEIVHSVRERFGFRTIDVRKGKGIFLNGKRITLKGVDRHSFRPNSGRALSRKDCFDDVQLLKEMNMNAVRMSHYPPDSYFLDLCDENGIYVLDELAGWQRPSYDTITAKRLVKEMVVRDVNHPSILFWDNGNEGGWNRSIDNDFAKYDPQERTVLHPWELFNGIDTDHYEGYASVKEKMEGENIFMPTEHLHGLYDGGLGAGLDDHWKLMWGNPLNGGMFLWVFADEGVVRTDLNCKVDVDGNHAPDGILSPNHEKEGSFYTIKEIWSPVYIETKEVSFEDAFNGKIAVENRYDFTNLNQCSFEWSLIKYPASGCLKKSSKVIARGLVDGSDIPARQNGVLTLDIHGTENADGLELKAIDKFGKELYTWRWKLTDNKKIVNSTVKTDGALPAAKKDKREINVNAGDFIFSFSKLNGELMSVSNLGFDIPFGNGPVFVSDKSSTIGGEKTKVILTENKEDKVIEVKNAQGLEMLRWTVYGTGWLKLEYSYSMNDSVEYMGVSFNYPEERMNGMKWLGRGPYRSWKNRIKGQSVSVWSNSYNNFAPATKWDYPEFPGYYPDLSWVVFDTQDGYITVLSGSDDLSMRVYSQKEGFEPRKANMIWPDGDISFMHAIPGIGTKFNTKEGVGPSGDLFPAKGNYTGTLYFYFGKAK